MIKWKGAKPCSAQLPVPDTYIAKESADNNVT